MINQRSCFPGLGEKAVYFPVAEPSVHRKAREPRCGSYRQASGQERDRDVAGGGGKDKQETSTERIGGF